MRPLSLCTWLLAVSLLTTGCATTAENRLAVRPFGKSSAKIAKEHAATKNHDAGQADKKEPAETSNNPFQKPSLDRSGVAAKPGKDTSGHTPRDNATRETVSAAVDKPFQTADSKSAGAFGPETLKLIDAELHDASAEERAFWYDQLKKVDPAVIPEILQARRLTAQVAEHQPMPRSPDNMHAGSRTERPEADSALELAGGVRTAAKPFPVVNADGQQLPGGKEDLQNALYQTDSRAAKAPVVPQNYETSSAAPGKRPFAVTRIADAGPATLPANPPSGTSSRNPLSRLMTMGQSGSATQAAANSPSGVSLMPPSGLDPRDAHGQLGELISHAENEVAQLQPGANESAQTEYIQRHVYLRLLYLMADHPERALTAIPGVEPADQEFWQQVLWAMANYFDAQHLPTAKDRAGQAVTQLTAATQRLREKADLEIRNLAFCREIAYFGNFVRFPRDEFRPGDSALLYAEIENFKSELTIDGQYRTLIRSTVEILSPSGEVRWHKEFAATEDLCINYRRDYFHNYQFTIPDRLPLGPHQLKLTVFDELSGKMVSQSINFVVR